MEEIKVLIRIRPFLENETHQGLKQVKDKNSSLFIKNQEKSFQGYFDKVLTAEATQKDVFDFIKPCLLKIKQGYNCSILTYGQTGSGKTYTMFGEEWSKNDNLSKNNKIKDEFNFIIQKNLIISPFSSSNGIIPNIFLSLFKLYIDNDNINFYCSYVQIYKEKVYDLLSENDDNYNYNKLHKRRFMSTVNKNNINININPFFEQESLKIKYDKINGVSIENAQKIKTRSFYEMFEVLRKGEISRKIRQTTKNEMSSRSHTIFIIEIEDFKNKLRSKIKLCDLAGSERYNSKNSYEKLHLDELCTINKSLTVLGNVIHYLGNKKTKNKFVPYKDSKLTEILEDSLGGNSLTYLIATISPNEENYGETINTLQFADRVNNVICKTSKNIISECLYNNEQLNDMKKELKDLKKILEYSKAKAASHNKKYLKPLSDEVLKLKKENIQLKKCLSFSSLQNLVSENNKLKRTIKLLTIRDNITIQNAVNNEKNNEQVNNSIKPFNFNKFNNYFKSRNLSIVTKQDFHSAVEISDKNNITKYPIIGGNDKKPIKLKEMKIIDNKEHTISLNLKPKHSKYLKSSVNCNFLNFKTIKHVSSVRFKLLTDLIKQNNERTSKLINNIMAGEKDNNSPIFRNFNSEISCI